MATSVTVNGSTYSVPANRETGWGTATSALLVALAANAGLDFTKAVFVSKQGGSGYSGMSPDKPKVSLAQALIVAAALTPSSSNRITIVVLDAGIYSETITAAQYVDIFAPCATFSGLTSLAADMKLTLFEATNTGAAACLNKSTSGVSTADVQHLNNSAGKGITLTGTGTLNARIGQITSTTSYSVGSGSTLNMFLLSLVSGTASVSGTANVVTAASAGLGDLKADGTVAMTGSLNMGTSGIGIKFGSYTLTVDTSGNVVVT